MESSILWSIQIQDVSVISDRKPLTNVQMRIDNQTLFSAQKIEMKAVQ